MAFKPDTLSFAVMERMVTLFSPTRGWSTRLWRSSPIDAFKHFVELIDGDASEGAKSYALGEARRRIENDLFIPPQDRGGVLKQLKFDAQKMVRGTTTYFALQSTGLELEKNYSLWVQAYLDLLDEDVQVGSSSVKEETLAWQLAAFLRSEGMSDEWIVNFVNFHLRHNEEVTTLAATIKLARNIITTKSEWTFFVPLTHRKAFNVCAPPLLQKLDFEDRFKRLLPGIEVPDNLGGLEISVRAIDKYAAIKEAQLVMRRVVDRHRVSHSKRQFSFADKAWISPGSWSVCVSLETELRFQVEELDSGGGGEMFQRVSEELEAALDLLTAADQTSSRAATIAAWATLETLFAGEGDYGALAGVADRAADILVCMYVRDIFTSLAIKQTRAGDAKLAGEFLDATPSQAAELVERSLQGHAMSVQSPRGLLARQRAISLNTKEINVIRTEIAAVLRRLYDMRNQVVHAGRMAPFGLQRTYEESIVLLSALLDELVRQHRDVGRTAREVAGRAAWLLTRVQSDRATPASLAELGEK